MVNTGVVNGASMRTMKSPDRKNHQRKSSKAKEKKKLVFKFAGATTSTANDGSSNGATTQATTSAMINLDTSACSTNIKQIVVSSVWGPSFDNAFQEQPHPVNDVSSNVESTAETCEEWTPTFEDTGSISQEIDPFETLVVDDVAADVVADMSNADAVAIASVPTDTAVDAHTVIDADVSVTDADTAVAAAQTTMIAADVSSSAGGDSTTNFYSTATGVVAGNEADDATDYAVAADVADVAVDVAAAAVDAAANVGDVSAVASARAPVTDGAGGAVDIAGPIEVTAADAAQVVVDDTDVGPNTTLSVTEPPMPVGELKQQVQPVVLQFSNAEEEEEHTATQAKTSITSEEGGLGVDRELSKDIEWNRVNDDIQNTSTDASELTDVNAAESVDDDVFVGVHIGKVAHESTGGVPAEVEQNASNTEPAEKQKQQQQQQQQQPNREVKQEIQTCDSQSEQVQGTTGEPVEKKEQQQQQHDEEREHECQHNDRQSEKLQNNAAEQKIDETCSTDTLELDESEPPLSLPAKQETITADQIDDVQESKVEVNNITQPEEKGTTATTAAVVPSQTNTKHDLENEASRTVDNESDTTALLLTSGISLLTSPGKETITPLDQFGTDPQTSQLDINNTFDMENDLGTTTELYNLEPLVEHESEVSVSNVFDRENIVATVEVCSKLDEFDDTAREFELSTNEQQQPYRASVVGEKKGGEEQPPQVIERENNIRVPNRLKDVDLDPDMNDNNDNTNDNNDNNNDKHVNNDNDNNNSDDDFDFDDDDDDMGDFHFPPAISTTVAGVTPDTSRRTNLAHSPASEQQWLHSQERQSQQPQQQQQVQQRQRSGNTSSTGVALRIPVVRNKKNGNRTRSGSACSSAATSRSKRHENNQQHKKHTAPQETINKQLQHQQKLASVTASREPNHVVVDVNLKPNNVFDIFSPSAFGDFQKGPSPSNINNNNNKNNNYNKVNQFRRSKRRGAPNKSGQQATSAAQSKCCSRRTGCCSRRMAMFLLVTIVLLGVTMPMFDQFEINGTMDKIMAGLGRSSHIPTTTMDGGDVETPHLLPSNEKDEQTKAEFGQTANDIGKGPWSNSHPVKEGQEPITPLVKANDEDQHRDTVFGQPESPENRPTQTQRSRSSTFPPIVTTTKPHQPSTADDQQPSGHASEEQRGGHDEVVDFTQQQQQQGVGSQPGDEKVVYNEGKETENYEELLSRHRPATNENKDNDQQSVDVVAQQEQQQQQHQRQQQHQQQHDQKEEEAHWLPREVGRLSAPTTENKNDDGDDDDDERDGDVEVDVTPPHQVEPTISNTDDLKPVRENKNNDDNENEGADVILDATEQEQQKEPQHQGTNRMPSVVDSTNRPKAENSNSGVGDDGSAATLPTDRNNADEQDDDILVDLTQLHTKPQQQQEEPTTDLPNEYDTTDESITGQDNNSIVEDFQVKTTRGDDNSVVVVESTGQHQQQQQQQQHKQHGEETNKLPSQVDPTVIVDTAKSKNSRPTDRVQALVKPTTIKENDDNNDDNKNDDNKNDDNNNKNNDDNDNSDDNNAEQGSNMVVGFTKRQKHQVESGSFPTKTHESSTSLLSTVHDQGSQAKNVAVAATAATAAAGAVPKEESIEAWLGSMRLQAYTDALKDIGVESIDDLQYLEAEDINLLGMRPIEKRKFQKALADHMALHSTEQEDAKDEARRIRVLIDKIQQSIDKSRLRGGGGREGVGGR